MSDQEQDQLESSNLEEYKKTISWLMDNQSAISVGNQKPEHAAALYELFFKRAKKEVVIFCKNLQKDVFDNPMVVSSLRNALSKGIAIKVLLQTDEPDGNFIKSLLGCAGLEIKKAREEDSNLGYNFSVKDTESYRFERNRNNTEAFAKMFQLEEAKKLHNAFDVMWRMSVKNITLPATA